LHAAEVALPLSVVECAKVEMPVTFTVVPAFSVRPPLPILLLAEMLSMPPWTVVPPV